ncbi:unnamed protein product [Lampetra planeri]
MAAWASWGSRSAAATCRRNSKLESFLERSLRWAHWERVRAYEPCVVERRYRFVVLTDGALLVMDNPPRSLGQLVELRDVTHVRLVNDLPEFLSGADRENAQHIVVTHRRAGTGEPTGPRRHRSRRRSAQTTAGARGDEDRHSPDPGRTPPSVSPAHANPKTPSPAATPGFRPLPKLPDSCVPSAGAAAWGGATARPTLDPPTARAGSPAAARESPDSSRDSRRCGDGSPVASTLRCGVKVRGPRGRKDGGGGGGGEEGEEGGGSPADTVELHVYILSPSSPFVLHLKSTLDNFLIGDHHGNCVVRNRQVAGSSETHAPTVTTTTSTSSSSTTTTTTSTPPDANHSGSNHTRARRGSETERELLRQFKVEEGEAVTRRRAFCAQYLSMLLLLSTALFFLCLAFVYVNIRTANERQGNATVIPMITRIDKMSGPAHERHVSRTGDLDCGDHVHIKSRRISFVDAYAFITSTSPLVNESMFNASLQTIIGSEADLGIRLLGEDTEQEVANLVDVRYLESTHPQRSFICRLRRAFLTVLHKLFIVFAGVGIVLGVLAYMKYRWRKEEEETRNMYDLVERIVEMLRSHSENCVENKSLQPVLPLPHVRDTLIPLQERRRMRRVWRRAVAFIAANESRVRTERQRMAGEDCEVWRWTQAAVTAPPPGKLPAKIWQGKAFHLDRRNSPLHSLTPCLKIRNMFDPDMEIGENWHLSINDAIMEKCHDNGGIVHIEVDKTSHEGCVYVKCLSPEHAGKAFKSLHGSWFDGKLVTVKYLWLERYHQRFPHAVTSNIPMQPSNRAANAAPSSSPPGCQVERHGDKTI